MGKLLEKLIRVFHLGRLPDEVRIRLESDGGILYLAEGVVTTAIFTHFKAPQAHSSYRRIVFIGFFALSKRRIVVRAKCYNSIDIDVPYDDSRFKMISFTVKESYLSLAFDASALLPTASGRIEIRLHIPNISDASTLLQEKGASVVSV